MCPSISDKNHSINYAESCLSNLVSLNLAKSNVENTVDIFFSHFVQSFHKSSLISYYFLISCLTVALESRTVGESSHYSASSGQPPPGLHSGQELNMLLEIQWQLLLVLADIGALEKPAALPLCSCEV